MIKVLFIGGPKDGEREDMAECPEKISVPVQAAIQSKRAMRLGGGDGYLQDFVYEVRPFQLSETEWVPVYCELALSNADVMRRLLAGYLQFA